jgi:adenosylhomocysteine nucleosidase
VITGIVVALPDELSTLTSSSIEKGHYVAVTDHLLVAYSGAGEKNAQRAANLLVSHGATALISWGCAAGLAAHLKPGDLVLADEIVDADHRQVEFDRRWQSQCKKILAAHLAVQSGRLVSSNQLISSSRDKKRLHLATNAIILDMESAAVAQVATEQHLPFLAIRAVADPVSMNLPQAVQHALNEQGDIVLSKLGWFLIAHPSELVGLVKLGLHFSAAKKTLERVAKQLNTLLQLNIDSNVF